MKHISDLMYWITEREAIRIKKEAGDRWPWTFDPILRDWRFCNVHRENDVVTRWIHNNWLYPHDGEVSLPFAMVLARMVNLPETLSDMGYPYAWDPEHFKQTIRDRKARKQKVWTNAYMITGGYSEGGETKEVIIARVLDGVFDKLKSNPIVVGDTLSEACEKIKSPGVGSFLAAQAIADIKHSIILQSWNAKDWWTWCAVGPGSTAGLNYLYERPQGKTLTEEQFRSEVNEIRLLIEDKLGEKLDAQNVQNCLCEFSKYVRTKYYGGRPKSTYTPAKPVAGRVG